MCIHIRKQLRCIDGGEDTLSSAFGGTFEAPDLNFNNVAALHGGPVAPGGGADREQRAGGGAQVTRSATMKAGTHVDTNVTRSEKRETEGERETVESVS